MNKKVITYVAIAVLIIGLIGLLFILNRSSDDEATTDDQTTGESNEADQNSEDKEVTDDQTTGESNETDQNSGGENTNTTTNIENSLCSGAELTLQQRESCDTNDNNNNESGNSNEAQPDPVDDSSQAGAGLYLDYSSADFNEYANKKRWLFFHANWCPLCVNLEEDILAHLSDIPDDVVIFKVDFDNSNDLRNRYGVSIQTTIVSVDGGGDKIKSHVASLDQSLTNLIANLS